MILKMIFNSFLSYALSWNKNRAGYLLSGAYDNKVNYWNHIKFLHHLKGDSLGY